MAELTENYNLKKPSDNDFYNIQDFNDNADIVDSEFKNQADRIKEVEAPSFIEAEADANIQTKETLPALFGKIKRAITRLYEHISSTNPHSGSSPTGHKHTVSDITSGVLPISRGGTGSSTAAEALKSLGITVTAKVINLLEGLKSNVQTQLDGKAASIHKHSASDVTSGILPVLRGGTGANTAAGALKNLGVDVTAETINLLDGISENIQTQFNGKADSSHQHSGADIEGGVIGSQSGTGGKKNLEINLETGEMTSIDVPADAESSSAGKLIIKDGTASFTNNSYAMTASANGLAMARYVDGNIFPVFNMILSPDGSVLFSEDMAINIRESLGIKNVVLWSGKEQMGLKAGSDKDCTQIDFKVNGEAVTTNELATGIVLVFWRTDSSGNEYRMHNFFVPKQMIESKPGMGHSFLLVGNDFSAMACKYLYISPDHIVGNAANTASDIAGNSGSGIKYNNSLYELRYVIGV